MHGEAQESDFVVAEQHLKNLHYLWKQAHLSFTPKIHGLLSHAVQQMGWCQGIGDTLEDIEWIQQISAKIEAHVSQMKKRPASKHTLQNGSHPEEQTW